jgi:hypothetical protein
MTVNELIEMLQDEDPDAEVRLLMQPSWPFEYSVGGLVRDEDAPAEGSESYDPETPTDDAEEPRNIVFLVEGQQLQYGNKNLFDCARRG